MYLFESLEKIEFFDHEMVPENNGIHNQYNVVSIDVDIDDEENLFNKEENEDLEITFKTTLNPF